MSQYITLLGTEDVVHAGNRMQDAADNMSRAASTFEEAVRQQRIMLDEFSILVADIKEIAARNTK